MTGIVPDAQGRFSIPESAVFAGETNFLRIRGEGPQPSRYSAAATVAIDPAVDSSSPNQVKYVSVSRSGTQVTVRWQLQQANGKKFKVYFTRADTGQAVLLTQFPLASTSTNITCLDQALASPCGVFSITPERAPLSQRDHAAESSLNSQSQMKRAFRFGGPFEVPPTCAELMYQMY